MKRLGRAIEVLAWGIFLAFAAAALVVRFWVLPDIERYREDIVAAMSRGIGLPVRVGEIRASWLGLRPQIGLSDVRIYDLQGREALVLPSIENEIAWSSLALGELRLRRVVIDAPRLDVRRDAAGELYIAGLKVAPGAGGGAGLGGLLGSGQFMIRGAEIEWHDELRGAPPLVFYDLDLVLENAGERHALGVRARTAPELGGGIDLRALVHGNDWRREALSGRVFLQIGYTDLSAWRAWVDYPAHVRSGQGALRVWATVEQGELKEATADVALAEVSASLADELAPLDLLSVQGRVLGRWHADGVELSGRGLAIAVKDGPQIPKTDFQIVWRPQAGGTLAASAVDLRVFGELAESLPLPPQVALRLEELAPRGRLTQARLEWSGPFDAPTRFAARAGFEDLALRARDGTPGFAGVSGTLEATREGGKLTLASSKASVELPAIFPEPVIPLDSLAGQLEWQRDPAGGVTVRVPSLSFANEHASGNLFGSYAWPGEGRGILDLSAVLNRGDVRRVRRYLPHVLPEPVREWLGEAIHAGEASDVRVRVRGDLRHFPFKDPATGQFEVTARVDKGVFEFAKGWPRIEDIVAELSFRGDRMEIVARSASMLGAQLAAVRVAMPTLAGPDRRVLVSGQADGATAGFLKFLQTSPLRDSAGAFTEGMSASGRGKLRLNLELPLAALAKSKVAGEFEFAGNQVGVLPWLPPVEDAAGKVAFTQSGFTLHDVKGRLFDGPIALSGGTRANRRVEVLARGSASFDATRALFDHPLRQHLSGSFAYTVAVRAQDGLASVSFESPLRGLESTLPAPLAKSAADALPLRVDVTPVARGQRDRISVSLGTLARAEVSRRKEGAAMVVQRTGVWLAPGRDQPVRLPERPGILVYGALPSFDLDRWRPLMAGDGGGDAGPVALDLKFRTLDAFGKRLRDVALRASAEAAGWSARIDADDVAGDVSYRAGAEPRVVARLARLTVPADAPGAASGPGPRPSDLPALDVVIDEFAFRGKQLGRIELVGRRAGEDWKIESASMSTPDGSLTGGGLWEASPSRTRVQFDLEAHDAGAFLDRMGYAGLVKGGRARLQGALVWRGDPSKLDLPSLRGTLEMQAENGQFLEIEPGIGKLISLMSLQALPRRVTLDFRDVFSKGFQFDRIASAALIDDGALQLKEFRMRGSAADVEMSGRADLARETQDLRVRVVPSLGDSAALGVAIVNPVAGVAAAIAQRILKNPLGQIFSYDYQVSGTWSDPKVDKIKPPPLPLPDQDRPMQ
jgi:uncharacterized protein (TIGR02099 family)